jgi:hypothetical protein
MPNNHDVFSYPEDLERRPASAAKPSPSPKPPSHLTPNLSGQVKSIGPLSSRVGGAAGCKVWVHTGLFGRDSSCWIVFQKRI